MAFTNDRWFKTIDGKRTKTTAHGTPGKRWQAVWVDPLGRQRSKSFVTRAEADSYLGELAHQRRSGTYVDPKAGRVTVGALAAKWLDIKPGDDVTVKTLQRYREIVNTHVLPTWRAAQVNDIRPSDVQAWVARLKVQKCAGREQVLSPASIRKIFWVFQMVMELAVTDGCITANPCASVKPPKATKSRRRYLSHAKVEELAMLTAQPAPGTRAAQGERAAREQYRLVVLTLAYCGLRWGELAALRVSGMTRTPRGSVRLHIDQAVTEVGGKFVWGLPKGREPRSVPVPTELADLLLAHIQHTGKGRHDLMFTGVRGDGPLRNRVFRRAGFDRAAAQMVDQDGNSLAGFTPHELRHTTASLAISDNANGKIVQRLLGHRSAAMTMDTYADLFEDDLDEAAELMGESRRRALSSAPAESSLNVGRVVSLAEARQVAAGQ